MSIFDPVLGYLWRNPVGRRDSYYVFHDESIPDKRWLLIGVLLVHPRDLEEVRRVLRACREKEGYSGEIHFSDLPGSFEGEYGAKARVARAWLREYENGLVNLTPFSALIVDRHHEQYDRQKFKRDYHAYNRFTAMALKAAISYFLGSQQLERVEIRFISDSKSRLRRPDAGWNDNFEKYLPERMAAESFYSEISGKSFPQTRVDLLLKDSAGEDLLQLCDLFLGSLQAALVGKCQKPDKRELAQIVRRWYQESKSCQHRGNLSLYRNFDVWKFPEPKEPIPFKIPPYSVEDLPF